MADTATPELASLTGAGTASGDEYVIHDASANILKGQTPAEAAIALATHGDIATQTELDAHAADTTSVHGITDTSAVALTADVITKAFMAAKGDLISASADNTPVILTVGTNGYRLIADSAQSSGLLWQAPTYVVQIQVTDPNGSAITTGDGKAYFRVGTVLNGCNLVGVAAHVTTVSSSGTPTVQIHNVTDTADMLSTAITIDANEKDSSTAAVAAVINGATDDVVTGDELRIDIDVAGTGAKGLIVELQFRLP